MVSVRVSETYDLSTKVNKMGIVGIHTPTGPLIERMWPGLVRQYGKFRFARCDVAMACASMLPADPLQIGVEAGAIAPQDMFNPILYRAVSNDTMNNFLSLMRYQMSIAPNSTNGAEVNNGSIISEGDPEFIDSGSAGTATTEIDNFDMYYGLLADTDSWRHAMPQAGLSMKNLVPLVHEVLSNNGINQASGAGVSGSPASGLNGQKVFGNYYQNTASTSVDSEVSNELTEVANIAGNVSGLFTRFKGRSMPMPFINTKFWGHPATDSPETGYDGSMATSTEGDNGWTNLNSNVGRVPPVYVGLIVLPPAVLNQLYYRIRVTWTIDFKDLQSSAEIMSWIGLSALGGLSYATDYATQSQSMSSLTAMVDTNGADVKKIMEGA